MDAASRRWLLARRKAAQRDLRGARLLGDAQTENAARLELGGLLLDLGYMDQAKIELLSVLDRADAMNDLDHLYKALYSLAAVYLALNELEQHLDCRRRGLAVAERVGNLVEIDYATALVGYALLYLSDTEKAWQYLDRSEARKHGPRPGCTRAGMGVIQAMSKVNRLGLVSNVSERVHLLARQRRWTEVQAALRIGLAAADHVSSSAAGTLQELRRSLP